MTQIEAKRPEMLTEADLEPRAEPFPSPATWRDQVIYFLLPDRFSDGGEATRPLYQPGQHAAGDKAGWMAAGKRFQGGTLRGVAGRLGYLRDLGVTAIWLGPIWKQRVEMDTYHGYAIQDFVDVDPRFGTRQDLRDLVDAAHARGMYVLLDVIYNHSGDNWFYRVDGQPRSEVRYRYEPRYPFHGWRAQSGGSVAAVDGADDGVWPREFQDPEFYTRAGSIERWDPDPWENPLHPNNEFRRGDFTVWWGDPDDGHRGSATLEGGDTTNGGYHPGIDYETTPLEVVFGLHLARARFAAHLTHYWYRDSVLGPSSNATLDWTNFSLQYRF